MSSIQESLKQAIPQTARTRIANLYNAILRLPEWPAANLHSLRRSSISRLAALKDIHRGERCFIIGNGPSLKNTDLTRLSDEYTFGMNRFYLAFPELGFTTRYYVTMNDLVLQQYGADLAKLSIPKFFSWRTHALFQPADDIHFLYTTYTGAAFAQDVTGRVWEGGTVTYVTLQLAFHMGFKQAVLIGVDHNYATQGKPNATVVSAGDDPNHFHPGYFGKGTRWQLPDLESWEKAYTLARETYAQAGREVLDATIGGKLTVFPKVDYLSLFK